MAARKECTPLREKATMQSPLRTRLRSPRALVLTRRGLSRSCLLTSRSSPAPRRALWSRSSEWLNPRS